MKKIVMALAVIISTALSAAAQDSREYKDLLTLFVSEKYDKVVQKATSYTEDEDTKKDAMPYLFLSMSYFEMNKKDELRARYPDAFKLCLKYVKAYSSKDKDRIYYAEYEDFFAKLRYAVIAEGELMMDQAKYTKAKSMYSYLINIDEKDAGAHIYLGMTFIALKSKKEAETAFATAKAMLTDKTAKTNTKELSDLLKNALITYSLRLNDEGSKGVAKEWMELGMDLFQNDKEYKVTYDSING
jgi:tetratricopeptide (TPR) repeat protein